MKPLIGLTCDTFDLPRFRVEGVRTEYARAIVEAGGVPLYLPSEAQVDTERLLLGLDAILFTGGGDPDGRHFGEPHHPKAGPPDPVRDRFELALARQAFQRDMPAFGICRGCQMMAVASGGKLIQDLPSFIPGTQVHMQKEARSHATHGVRVLEGSRLLGLLGEKEIVVNSFHHQAVAEGSLASLRVSALSGDGVVEAVESPDRRFFLGVQWHPEDLQSEDPLARRLFQAFVRAAKEAAK